MASTPPTTFPRGPAPNGPARPAPTLVPAGARRQRRWSLALLALLVTLGSALAFAVLWLNAGSRKPVLALANDVPAGQIIQDDDLTTVRISTDPGITPVSSSARDQVVGQPAAADLLAGTLLTPEAVGDTSGLSGNEVVVAIPIAIEEFPDLETGNPVRLYHAASTGGPELEDAGLIGTGRVFSVGPHEEGSSTDVRVEVIIDSSLAARAVAASHADEIVVVRGGGA
jgi:SAF domain